MAPAARRLVRSIGLPPLLELEKVTHALPQRARCR